jgi:hypothetical protein
MEGIDARGYLIGWLKGLNNMYNADVNGVPDDKINATHGGCTRTVPDLTADTIGLLNWVTDQIEGKPYTGDYGADMKALAAKLTTKEQITAAMTEACDRLAGAVGAASNETLNKTVMAPWQMETPLFMMAMIAVSHIWYHDGQLNFIHALGGDDKIYWMM